MNSQDKFIQLSLPLTLSSILFGVAAHLLSCAAPPPPLAVQATPIWAEVITRTPQSKAPQTVKVTHELWTPSSVSPPLSRVEVTLAKTGVLADINGSEGNYEISVGPHECQTRWSALDRSAKTELNSRVRLCQSQLTSDQKSRLRIKIMLCF